MNTMMIPAAPIAAATTRCLAECNNDAMPSACVSMCTTTSCGNEPPSACLNDPTPGGFATRQPTHHAICLKTVDAYPFDELVDYYVDRMGMSEPDAQQMFTDVKRFLALCAMFPFGLAPTPRLDLGWHSLCLFGRGNRALCLTLYGRYVDHQPTGRRPSKQLGCTAKTTVRLARQVFGTLSSNWALTADNTDCAEQCEGSTNCQDAKCNSDDQ